MKIERQGGLTVAKGSGQRVESVRMRSRNHKLRAHLVPLCSIIGHVRTPRYAFVRIRTRSYASPAGRHWKRLGKTKTACSAFHPRIGGSVFFLRVRAERKAGFSTVERMFCA